MLTAVIRERERWIAVSGLLLGFGIAFAVVDAAVLLRFASGFEASSMRTILGIGMLVTSVTAIVALLILTIKLRRFY